MHTSTLTEPTSTCANSKGTLELGFWAGILATVLTLGFVVLAILGAPSGWEGIEAYANSYRFIQMAHFIPVILLTPVMVVLMCCIHQTAPEGDRAFTLAGIALAAVYAAIISSNYYLQLYVVRLNLLSGAHEGLSLLAMPNFHSAFFALETIGYAFLSLGTIMVSRAFHGAGRPAWIRRLFVSSGALGLAGAAVAPFDVPLVIFAALGLWSLFFPAATALVALDFKRRLRAA